MVIVDAHLDLAYNVSRGRDVLLPARQQRPTDNEIPTVGFPDLHAGGIGLICATIFCEPAHGTQPGYRSPDEARAMAVEQWHWYRAQEQAGRMRFIRSSADLDALGSEKPCQNAILLMEGADALGSAEDVEQWHREGLRMVGLAWKRTRHAGGTGEPGPLTAEGIEIVKALDHHGIIHDVSHLAEESFWQLLDASAGPVAASHSNCRAIVPTDRQLSDQMISALAARGGVIGINFFDKFLIPPTDYGKRRAGFGDVIAHTRHICDVTGSVDHVGIGTDLDGGLGREQIPQEITTIADLARLPEALKSAGFDETGTAKIMGGNWRRFFSQSLR